MCSRPTLQIAAAFLLLAIACTKAAVPARDADNLVTDPTRPLFFEGDNSNGAVVGSNGYTLDSILTRGGSHIAVINSQRVRVGEMVGIATVQAITEDSVTLNVDGRTEVLRLYKSTIRTPARNGG